MVYSILCINKYILKYKRAIKNLKKRLTPVLFRKQWKITWNQYYAIKKYFSSDRGQECDRERCFITFYW